MQLNELKPKFIRYEKTFEGEFNIVVETIEECQGIRFLCPHCFIENKGSIGTHQIICWSSLRGITDDVRPRPGRWCITGTGFDDLTLGAEPGKSRSVLIKSDWHGYITNGMITNA